MLSQSEEPEGLAAEILMSRMAHSGALLVVEGVDDLRFWTDRCHKTCELIDGRGKRRLVAGMQQLDGMSFAGALGVVDEDHDALLGITYGSRNVVATDAHDLECLLCRSSALNRVLAEFGSPKKIHEFEERTGSDVRTGLLERTVVFGRVRWAVAKFGLDPGGGLRFQKFLDPNTWEVDEEGLLGEFDAVARRNGRTPLRDALAELDGADPWRVAQGHDMVGILRVGLQNVLGEIRNVGTDQIAGILRAGIPPDELLGTGLCREMRAWEHENTGFPVLP